MVSEHPQQRSDTVVGSTPKSGASAQQASGSGTQTDMGAKAQDVVEQTQQKAGEVVGQAKEQATSQLSSQKDRAVESLDTVAHAIRQTSQHLRESNQAPIAEYADKAAERMEQFTTQLRNKDVQTMMRDVERYARRQPAIVLGSAFVLGLLGARFLKSTAQREDDEETGDYRTDRYRPGTYSGSYRGQYARGGYGGQYAAGASPGGYGTRTGTASGATTGQYGAQYTGSATTGKPGATGSSAGTGERSWSVRGTEAG
ncbi:MAG: hypothetical protein LC793_14125 [Thermomicrobia bacterium]|nr:hypothetical protein [Thermomicrobia bacterium]MCA1724600.1 hypothetical protein [Thermomicrobia bacterium]